MDIHRFENRPNVRTLARERYQGEYGRGKAIEMVTIVYRVSYLRPQKCGLRDLETCLGACTSPESHVGPAIVATLVVKFDEGCE